MPNMRPKGLLRRKMLQILQFHRWFKVKSSRSKVMAVVAVRKMAAAMAAMRSEFRVPRKMQENIETIHPKVVAKCTTCGKSGTGGTYKTGFCALKDCFAY